MIEEAVKTRLTGFAGFSALAASRVYPLQLPQNVILPAVTYQRIANTSYSSSSGSSSGLAETKFQFDCWAKNYGDTMRLREKIRLALLGYTGTINTVDGPVRITGVIYDSDRDGFDNNALMYRSSIDLTIWHDEAQT